MKKKWKIKFQNEKLKKWKIENSIEKWKIEKIEKIEKKNEKFNWKKVLVRWTDLFRICRWTSNRWTWPRGSWRRRWRSWARSSSSRRCRRAPSPASRPRRRPDTRRGKPSAASCWSASATAGPCRWCTDCRCAPVRRRAGPTVRPGRRWSPPGPDRPTADRRCWAPTSPSATLPPSSTTRWATPSVPCASNRCCGSGAAGAAAGAAAATGAAATGAGAAAGAAAAGAPCAALRPQSAPNWGACRWPATWWPSKRQFLSNPIQFHLNTKLI